MKPNLIDLTDFSHVHEDLEISSDPMKDLVAICAGGMETKNGPATSADRRRLRRLFLSARKLICRICDTRFELLGD